MSLFRSERMSFCRLILHQDYAFDCLVELGYEGKAQFVHIDDSDHMPNNKFVNEIQRCVEIERMIKRLQEEINEMGMHTVYYEDADEQKPKTSDLNGIELTIQHLDKELTDVQSQCAGLQKRRLTLYEHKQVLENIDKFIGQFSVIDLRKSLQALLKDNSSMEGGFSRREKNSSLFVVTGSIPLERFEAFEVMIWRVARGNAHINHAQYELTPDLVERFNENPYKNAFMVATLGEQLHQKILKVCAGFGVQIFKCASTANGRWMDLKNIDKELMNLKQIFQVSCEHKKRILAVASGDLFLWRATLKKIQSVYYLLNRFDIVHDSERRLSKYLKTDCWIVYSELRTVRAALMRGSRVSAGDKATLTFPPVLTVHRSRPVDLKAPTYFRTNKFTIGFQHLINAYGTASYRELNPAPYTIITFPFLFAIMFGDVGHGIILAVFAFVLICLEKKIERQQDNSLKSSEIFDLLFAGRYIILLMGLFSIYAGLVYNDMFSKAFNVFGSSWEANMTFTEVRSSHMHILHPDDPAHFSGKPYILGVDPIWDTVAENAIIFNNSLKMKIAIILGVFQMLFGLLLSAGNALFFRSKIDLYLVFLPQFIFLTCLFLYLVILIFYKWLAFGGHNLGEYSASCAPSILITFIDMVLLKSAEEPLEGCYSNMYTGQPVVQRLLLCCAILAVPVMLCGKPLHFMYQHRRMKTIKDPEHQAEFRRSTWNSLRKSLRYSVEFAESDPHMQRVEGEEQLSEIWIHQGIHTIECVLGSISHTASYLRLWALSLAHSQLSDVLWQMVLRIGLNSDRGYYNSIVIFFSFIGFAVLTVAILVVMEGLSAFLHTLRLHWVEFQSKFYGGLGEPFLPFRFERSKRKDSYV